MTAGRKIERRNKRGRKWQVKENKTINGRETQKNRGKSKIPLIFDQCLQKDILGISNICLSFQLNLLIKL